ncbi:amidase [Demetria terragena]|uniref:amidase n=1 Tax=Demetria terragena TaxID=63959 RepID=UPI00037FB39C|nr:amidase [Demetria terragena]
MRDSLAWRSAAELLAEFSSGTSTPVQAHQAVQEQIAERESELNALWHQDAPERVLACAQESARRWEQGTPRGALDGVPVTVKENVARAGIPMPAGCAGVTPTIPDRNAPIVERIEAAGGIIIGSTVMPDWGMLSSGVSSLHGITRSPLNPAWTTGGSSSGAGAATAGGYGPLHVGSDIGGSIRLPGTWLGIPTLKPTSGLVALDTPYPGRCAGPMARTVDDLSLLLSVIGQHDARDWTSSGGPRSAPGWDGIDGLRVGLLQDAGCGPESDAEVRAVVDRAAATLTAAGARVEPVDSWMTPDLLARLDTFWRVRSYVDYAALTRDQQAKVLPFIARWVTAAQDVSGARLMECHRAMDEIAKATTKATAAYDILLSPVAPMAAFPAEWPMPWGDSDEGMAHIGFTVPFNMSGQPAATVNGGFTGDGRPVGIQIAGQRFADEAILKIARWFESGS